ncbi:MAG: hypothetical protein RL120_11830 [Gammaproteobacteria bacterium]
MDLPEPNLQQESPGSQLFGDSYFYQRILIGYVGWALALTVIAYSLIVSGFNFESSVSAYYYTGIGDFYVGCLFAIGLFLCTYTGPDGKDIVFGVVAGVSAIFVALLPIDMQLSDGTQIDNGFIGVLHWVAATTLFAMFGLISTFVFTKHNVGRRTFASPLSNIPEDPERKKLHFRYIYCGIFIFACMFLILLFKVILKVPEFVPGLTPTFLFEELALIAFAYSWSLKAGALRHLLAMKQKRSLTGTEE